MIIFTDVKHLLILPLLFLLSCKGDVTPPTIPATCYDSVYAAGDSFTAFIGYGYVSYPEYLQDSLKIPIFNGGISGQTSTQIADRYLKRDSYINSPVILWLGANNNWHSSTIKADIRRMIGDNPNYWVLEIMSGSLPERWKGTDYYEHNIQLNNELAAEHGEHFVWIKSELQKYMTTAQDSIDVIEHDGVPTSMRSDWLHHNNLANQKIAALLAEKLNCRSKSGKE